MYKQVPFLCVHSHIITTSQKFFRFPCFSFSPLHKKTNSPFHDTVSEKTSGSAIGWSLLPCVLWLAEVLVHAWGMQAGRVRILWRKSVIYSCCYSELASDKRDFLLTAAEAETFTFGISVWFLQNKSTLFSKMGLMSPCSLRTVFW